DELRVRHAPRDFRKVGDSLPRLQLADAEDQRLAVSNSQKRASSLAQLCRREEAVASYRVRDHVNSGADAKPSQGLGRRRTHGDYDRSEEHTSELQSLTN